MPKSIFYVCTGCFRNQQEHRNPSERVCKYCNDDLVSIRKLHTQIVAKYPVFRQVPVGEVMTRLWKWFEKHSGTESPPREAPPVPSIEELDKVF